MTEPSLTIPKHRVRLNYWFAMLLFGFFCISILYLQIWSDEFERNKHMKQSNNRVALLPTTLPAPQAPPPISPTAPSLIVPNTPLATATSPPVALNVLPNTKNLSANISLAVSSNRLPNDQIEVLFPSAKQLALTDEQKQLAQKISLNVSNWRKLSSRFGDAWISVGLDVELTNTSPSPLKDFLLRCVFYAPSGTALALHYEPIFEQLLAGERKSILGKIRMGPASGQTDTIDCSIVAAHSISTLLTLQPLPGSVYPLEYQSLRKEAFLAIKPNTPSQASPSSPPPALTPNPKPTARGKAKGP